MIFAFVVLPPFTQRKRQKNDIQNTLSLFALEGTIEVALENDEDGEIIKSLLIQKCRSYAYQL